MCASGKKVKRFAQRSDGDGTDYVLRITRQPLELNFEAALLFAPGVRLTWSGRKPSKPSDTRRIILISCPVTYPRVSSTVDVMRCDMFDLVAIAKRPR